MANAQAIQALLWEAVCTLLRSAESSEELSAPIDGLNNNGLSIRETLTLSPYAMYLKGKDQEPDLMEALSVVRRYLGIIGLRRAPITIKNAKEIISNHGRLEPLNAVLPLSRTITKRVEKERSAPSVKSLTREAKLEKLKEEITALESTSQTGSEPSSTPSTFEIKKPNPKVEDLESFLEDGASSDPTDTIKRGLKAISPLPSFSKGVDSLKPPITSTYTQKVKAGQLVGFKDQLSTLQKKARVSSKENLSSAIYELIKGDRIDTGDSDLDTLLSDHVRIVLEEGKPRKEGKPRLEGMTADQIQKLKIRLSKLYLEKSGQEGFTGFDAEYTAFLKSETEAMQIGRALKETDKLDPLASLIVGGSADAIHTERWQRISSSVLQMVAQAQNHNRYHNPKSGSHRHFRELYVNEARSGFIYREEQIEIIESIVDNPSQLHAAKMGIGKTSAIIPTAIDILSKDKKKFVFTLLPPQLLASQYEEIEGTTLGLFDRAGMVFEFSRGTLPDISENGIEQSHEILLTMQRDLLRAKSNGSYCVSTQESIHSLCNKMVELQNKRLEVHKKIQALETPSLSGMQRRVFKRVERDSQGVLDWCRSLFSTPTKLVLSDRVEKNSNAARAVFEGKNWTQIHSEIEALDAGDKTKIAYELSKGDLSEAHKEFLEAQFYGDEDIQAKELAYRKEELANRKQELATMISDSKKQS